MYAKAPAAPAVLSTQGRECSPPVPVQEAAYWLGFTNAHVHTRAVSSMHRRCPETGSSYLMGGPIWSDPIHDPTFVQALISDLDRDKSRCARAALHTLRMMPAHGLHEPCLLSARHASALEVSGNLA